MHFTRRLLDPRCWGPFLSLSLLAAVVAVGCSSSDEPNHASLSDAGADAPDTVDASDASDAGQGAAPFDGRPRAVECASSPCATALVTTLGRSVDEDEEGFCVLLDDGTVACWGGNRAGQLGRGEGEGQPLVDSSVPARVAGLSNVVALDHSCAVDESGGVWCWGTGPFSWSGDAAGTSTTHTTAVRLDLPPVTKVARTFDTACAVLTTGDVQCWGSNARGQLGPVTETFSGAPVRITLPSGAPASALEVGNASFLVREDGSIVSWGANPGIGRVSPSTPDSLPQPVSLDRVTQIDSAYDNACALANGDTYCWGARVSPVKGKPNDRALPEPAWAPEPLVQIATTRTEGYALYDGKLRDFKPYRWCAVGDSGNLYCWGFNESGQAGTGDEEYVARATRVVGLPEESLVAQVKTTTNTTCALLTTGRVYCWGSNYYGQLGNGLKRGKSLTPTEVVLP